MISIDFPHSVLGTLSDVHLRSLACIEIISKGSSMVSPYDCWTWVSVCAVDTMLDLNEWVHPWVWDQATND